MRLPTTRPVVDTASVHKRVSNSLIIGPQPGASLLDWSQQNRPRDWPALMVLLGVVYLLFGVNIFKGPGRPERRLHRPA